MTIQQVRKALDQQVVPSLSDPEWKWLAKKRYVSEIQRGERTMREVAGDIRDIRLAFRDRHPGQRQLPGGELERAPRVAFASDPRTKTLSDAIARLARKDHFVERFRRDVLGGRVLSATEADLWLARESKAAWREKDGRIRIRLHGKGTTDLNRLERLAQDLADVYPWQETDAERFVLTGRAPHIHSVQCSTQSRRIGALSRVVLTIDPMVPPREVATFYRGVRRIFYPRRTRRLSEKHAELAAFDLNRPQGERWAKSMKRWNAECPKKAWRFEHESNFRRDCRRAVERLLGDPALADHCR